MCKRHNIYYIFPASEYRDLLLFYILPVMKDIMDDSYLQHLALLVRGTYVLCQDCISPEELGEAKDALQAFYRQMEELYGKGHR